MHRRQAVAGLSSRPTRAKEFAMKRSVARVLKITGFGLACVLAGAYLGINHAYDQVAATLPEMIKAAGCITPD